MPKYPVRGMLAIIVLLATALFIGIKIEIPREWWYVVICVCAFYFEEKIK